eukprot:m.97918 g.97918  ORF g.97918 m.97918 type:complete len:466 (+) comp27022_c1_seq1:277-1674(+)
MGGSLEASASSTSSRNPKDPGSYSSWAKKPEESTDTNGGGHEEHSASKRLTKSRDRFNYLLKRRKLLIQRARNTGKKIKRSVSKHVSFGSSSNGRLQTLAVLIFSMYGMVIAWSLCTFWSLMLLLFPLTTLPMVAYLYWMFKIDGSPRDGRRTPFLRKAFWWPYFCDYFPIHLYKTAELDPSRKYVLGYHPHGIISVGAFAAFATDGAIVHDLTTNITPQTTADQPRGFSSLFPNIDRHIVTLPINFVVPFAREYLLHLGMCESSKTTFRKVLTKPGKAVVVVVGGAKESVETENGGMHLVLEKRRGFVREAIRGGADLVPVLAFGENDLYATHAYPKDHIVHRLQDTLRAWTGFTVPLFYGRGVFFKNFGPLPFRKDVNIVCGEPMQVTREEYGPCVPITQEEFKNFKPIFNRQTQEPENDHAKLVEEVHHRYVSEIKELWDTFKDAPWNEPGIQRRKSLTVTS